jgi:hypothetical protein
LDTQKFKLSRNRVLESDFDTWHREQHFLVPPFAYAVFIDSSCREVVWKHSEYCRDIVLQETVVKRNLPYTVALSSSHL